MNFPTYSQNELKNITINGICPESMTLLYDCADIKIERFKKNLLNDKDVFVVSTQKKKPVHRFKEYQEVTVNSQYLFGDVEAYCFGKTEFIHKGFRMIAYYFQLK
ncbi:hypothetical protein ABLV58_06350 [Klebsiella sp. JB_Kp046]|uniref:hypothetical protein n=1 Tax=Klebsiella sp. JB_Kp046 TaxID=3153398 RepID=UPI0032B4BC45